MCKMKMLVLCLLVLVLNTCSAQEMQTLPESFGSLLYATNEEGGFTISDLVSVLTGEKTFEIDGKNLIIRQKQSDRLTRQEKEISLLLEPMSSQFGGKDLIAFTKTKRDYYMITRVLVNGEEQPQNVLAAFQLELIQRIGYSRPQANEKIMERAKFKDYSK